MIELLSSVTFNSAFDIRLSSVLIKFSCNVKHHLAPTARHSFGRQCFCL